MKKLILVLMVGVILLIGCVMFGVAQNTVIAPGNVTVKSPATDVIVPVLTTVAVVSESLPLVNRKVHGILHLLVALFKLFRNK